MDMDEHGWVHVSKLLPMLKNTRATRHEVETMVASSQKQRFSIDRDRIRANQGHSKGIVNDDDLAVVESVEQVPVAVHSTTAEAWDSIQKCGELRRMTREHVHFATEHHMLREQKGSSGVALKLDLKRALEAGHEFRLSSNKVLLTKGPLPVEFLTPVDRESAFASPPV